MSVGSCPEVILAKKRDFSVRKHHPWIFSGAVASGEAGVGETVKVISHDGEALGFGSYSPNSLIRVRMLSFDPQAKVDAPFVTALVERAVKRRAELLAKGYTDAVRLLNAENDGLPGVVADYYHGFIVCQFTSAGADFWKMTIAAALKQAMPLAKGVAERLDVEVRAKEGLICREALVTLVGEEPPALIEIHEGKVKFLVDVFKGHKTGFYLDQRDARAAVAELSRGKEVLNCFSYTGGFGLAAAAAGARAVTQVDISSAALKLARENAELNALKTETVEDDVFKFLRQCRDARKTFDLIVLDPPKFAVVKSQVMKAARGYKDINLLAMKLLRPNGMLATFSCSGAMTPEGFDQVLAEAARDAGRDFQVIAHTRQASDHPVAITFPEGLYLKGVILRG